MAQVETAAETAPAPPKPPAPNKHKGRPPASHDSIPRALSFFDRMAGIPTADWGTRARVKIYRVEPHIDRVSLGKKRYIKDCLEPIDEDTIKRAAWGGSGTYRLYLTFKQPTEREGKEIDSIELDILDTQYPPRLEPGEWLDIPENAKWKWAKSLLEPAPVAAPTPISNIVELLNASNEIRRTAIEEMRQTAPPTVAAPTENPMVTAMALAKELLTIRADNPMVTLMSEQLTAMRAELAAQRVRSDSLTDKLSERAKETDKPADPLAMVKTIFETFKSVRNEAADIMPGSSGRSRLGPWMEFFQPVLPSLVETLRPVAIAIAQQAMQPNPAQQHAAGPAPQIPASAYKPAAPPPPQQDFGAFLDLITPRMLHFLRDYDDPAPSFASWLHDGWGDVAQRAVDNIVALGGPPALIAWYQTSKYWPAIAPVEQEFSKFLSDVIAWKPEPDESDAEEPTPPVDATAAPVIDLETDSEEAN